MQPAEEPSVEEEWRFAATGIRHRGWNSAADAESTGGLWLGYLRGGVRAAASAPDCLDFKGNITTPTINPAEQVVVAIQSAWLQPHDSDAEAEPVAMIRAAVRALRTEPAP